jgi:Protein of unknown function (DUF1569)
MKRRTLLFARTVVATGAVGWIALPTGTPRPLTIGFTKLQLAKFKSAKINSSGGWTPAQVFEHLAQSVEYSMTGYPEPKSAVFQSTVGAAAFALFQSRGAMNHSLTDIIAGAPALAANDNQDAALDRLLDSLAAFDAFSGALKPHFAYGSLDKNAYASAHAMHVFNHLTELSV